MQALYEQFSVRVEIIPCTLMARQYEQAKKGPQRDRKQNSTLTVLLLWFSILLFRWFKQYLFSLTLIQLSHWNTSER